MLVQLFYARTFFLSAETDHLGGKLLNNQLWTILKQLNHSESSRFINLKTR